MCVKRELKMTKILLPRTIFFFYEKSCLSFVEAERRDSGLDSRQFYLVWEEAATSILELERYFVVACNRN